MQYFRFLPDPAKLLVKNIAAFLRRADGTFKIHVGYEVNAAADIRRNQSVPYF